MKKQLILLGLSTLLLASCSSSKTLTLEEQLAANYNIDNLNVEIHDYDNMYQDSIKSSLLILNCVDSNLGPQITSTGSGFTYKSFGVDDYYVITNHHVAPDITRRYFVVSYTGQIVEAEFIGTAGASNSSKKDFLDCSVLKVKDIKGMQLSKIVNGGDYTQMDNPSTGDSVYALGNPANINLFGSIAKGVVSNGKRIIRNYAKQDIMLQDHAIQIDLPINPGNSGGPLFNEYGEVIGVNTFKLTKNQANEPLTGLNFSLPIHDMVIAANYIINNYKGSPVKFTPYSLGQIGAITLYDIDIMTISDKKRNKIPLNIVNGVYVEYSDNDTLPSQIIITNAGRFDVVNSFDLKRAIFEASEPYLDITYLDKENKTHTAKVKLI